MRVTVKGTKSKDRIEEFTEKFISTYLKGHEDRVSVVVQIGNPDGTGSCECLANSPRIVACRVVVDKFLLSSEDALLEILSHELIHVKQYVKGQLVDLQGGVSEWRGKSYIDEEVGYSNSPWEKDAFRNQRKVMKNLKTLLGW